ncbi:LETM1 domain-containing 1 [Brachionus plicatilis]|uniref:LETM1 domain-containing 1 n=1 Tax=Brachionus plicatilis TaxID=10195 RepID=A0A3M7S8V7_BRAPC|nr:LETM1 domain-containing 1 [Brachionus plicatilis]
MKALISNIVSSPRVKLKPYGSKLQQRYPKIYRLFSVLRNGTVRFSKETFTFFNLKFQLWKNPHLIEQLSWKEVETYRQVPRDWKKVAPVMLVSSFPVLNYIVLPIAYAYPHKLLSNQFWTLEQILKFGEIDYYNKVKHYGTILELLLIHADDKLNDSVAKNFLFDFVNKIKDGEEINTEQVIELKPILRRPEFNLKLLSYDHLNLLEKIENSRKVFNLIKSSNLAYYAYWLRETDRKLLNQDIDKIPIEYMYSMCFERGINSRSQSINDLKLNLKYWLDFTEKLFDFNHNFKRENQEYFTLYLHSKILLRSSINRKMPYK